MLNLEEEDQVAQNYGIEIFINHENYNRTTKQNDIAVIKLAKNVNFNDRVRPACLWSSENIGQTKVIATGWGSTENYGPSSKDLLKVQLDLLNNDICSEYYEDQSYDITGKQLCVGVLAGGKDTCQGGKINQRKKSFSKISRFSPHRFWWTNSNHFG